ncbi:sugar kinase [Wenjunlia vitaminophila]|nr:sugar kinase [Wenjunlia vitaminophila]
MTTPTTGTAPAAVDAVCLGESMVTFVPEHTGPLADAPTFHRGVGGAESNVACYLALSGHSTRWISRVGADGFGDHLVAEIAAAGVDVDWVRRDPTRPTGIYFKERLPGRTAVTYYRAGSAATVMSPELVPRQLAWSGRVLHLSGITAALSASCRELVRELTRRAAGRPLVSFDVNYRPSLWKGPRHPGELLELARGCDIVFVGEDEAEAAWGTTGAAELRAALPEPGTLVVKQGATGAVAHVRRPDGTDDRHFEPALHVDVVEPVGAGDAFAAGFLSAALRGLPPAARLRHGHVLAAVSLTVPADLGRPPSRAVADRLAAMDEDAWRALRLGPGWAERPGTVEDRS